MAPLSVVAPEDSVMVTLKGPGAAVREAFNFSFTVGEGCLCVTLPTLADTTVMPGFEVVTTAPAVKPVPVITVVSFARS